MASHESNSSLFLIKIRWFLMYWSQWQCKAHMEKSVCIHSWTLKIYEVEGTVLVSVRIFVNKMNTYRLKRWNVRTTCKAVNCFSNVARVKYSIVISFTPTSIFIKLVNSEPTSYQPTRVQGKKTIWRLEIILRTIVIKKRARNIPQYYK